MEHERRDTLVDPAVGDSELDPWDRTLQLLYASPAPVRRRQRLQPWVAWTASALGLACAILVLRLLIG